MRQKREADLWSGWHFRMIVQYFIQNKMLSRGNKFQIAISCTVFFAFGIFKNWICVPGIGKMRNENFIAKKKTERLYGNNNESLRGIWIVKLLRSLNYRFNKFLQCVYKPPHLKLHFSIRKSWKFRNSHWQLKVEMRRLWYTL